MSIALGLSQRGGEEAYVELVLLVSWGRGVQSSVLRSAWCWGTGLVYLGCRVSQGIPISQTSHHSQPQHPPVPHQVLVRAALLLFSSLSQENLFLELWSFFSQFSTR